jgi:hypothetical protein
VLLEQADVTLQVRRFQVRLAKDLLCARGMKKQKNKSGGKAPQSKYALNSWFSTQHVGQGKTKAKNKSDGKAPQSKVAGVARLVQQSSTLPCRNPQAFFPSEPARVQNPGRCPVSGRLGTGRPNEVEARQVW